MKSERITKTKDYSRISKNSQKLHSGSFLILYNLITEEHLLKFGFTVSKRVGNAVKRNRCKRLIRVIMREIVEFIPLPSAELVIIAKPAFLERKYRDIKNEFIKTLEKLK